MTCGALNASPPDKDTEEGRGVGAKRSSGFLSDHGRSEGGKSALEGCSVGVGGCKPSGGGFKALWDSGLLGLRWAGPVVDGVAPVNMDFGCVDMRGRSASLIEPGARASQRAQLCQSTSIAGPRSTGVADLRFQHRRGTTSTGKAWS